MGTAREYRLLARVADSEYAESWRAVASGADGHQPARVLFVKSWAADPEMLAALVTRIEALSAVAYPNLVVPWGLGRAAGRLAVVLPAPVGPTLAELAEGLRSGETALPLDRAVHIIAEAAGGLAGLHQAGVVHGGISAEDVVVGLDGSVRLVCDGVRLVFELTAGQRTAAPRTDPRHRAPEIGRGAAHDGTTDVYALASVAFELVTGVSVDAARDAAARQSPPEPIQAPSAIDRAIPARFDEVLLAALDPAREKRPADGSGLRDSLWEYLDGMGQVVTPAQLAELARKASGGFPQAFDPDESPAADVPIRSPFPLEPLATSRSRDYRFDDDTPDGEAPAATAPSTSKVTEHTVKVALPVPGDGEETPAPTVAEDASHRLRTSPLIPVDPAMTGAAGPQAPPRTFVDAPPPTVDLGAGAVPSPVDPSEDTDGAETPLPGATPPPDPSAPPYTPAPPEGTPAPPPGQQAETPPSSPFDAMPHRVATRPSPPPRRGLALGWVAVIALLFGGGGFALGRFLPLPETSASGTDWADLELPPLVELVGPGPSGLVLDLDDLDDLGDLEDLEDLDEDFDPDPEEVAEASDVDETEAVAETEAPAPAKATATRQPPPRQKQARRRPRVQSGRLTIIADHRAQVFIDGRDTGRHTPLQGFLVPAGRREVKLVAASGRTHTETVVIRAGQVTQLRVAMR